MNHLLLRPVNVILLLVVTMFGACQMPIIAAPAPGNRPQDDRRPQGGALDETVTPLVWTWQTPLGRAAEHDHVIKMVRAMCNRSPEQVADLVCDEIVARGLARGQVCVLLQGFGGGDGDFADKRTIGKPALWHHWSDGLAHKHLMDPNHPNERITSKDASTQWWATLWMSHGIAECRDFMERFIARYEQRQSRDARIPDPTRFHFDTERGVLPEYTARYTVEAFAAMKRDPRWPAEHVPGFGGKTMAELYIEAGKPAFDPARNWGHGPNQRWASWYAGICWQAFDGGMDAAAYQPIRAAWPSCKSSNYKTSARFDGVDGRYRADSPREWYKVKNNAFGDLQAPVLYFCHPDLIRAGETHESATLRIAEAIIDANIHSFGGPHDDVVPWLELNGNRQKLWNRSLEVSADMMEEMLRMLHAKGVDEMIIWSHANTPRSPENWTRFAQLINNIWSAEIRSARAEFGRSVATDPALLACSDDEAYRMRARRDRTIKKKRTLATRTRLAFDTEFDARNRPRALEIEIESWIDRPRGKRRVWVRNWKTGKLDRLDVSGLRAKRSTRSVIDERPRHHVSGDGRVEIVIQHESDRAFTSNIDSVRVLAAERGAKPRRSTSRASATTATPRRDGRITKVAGTGG